MENVTAKNKNLKTGENYGDCFGLDKEKNQSLVYNGENSWTAKDGDKEKTFDSPDTTAKAIEYVNRPSTVMGA